jgi:transcriptional regulator with XRE-family HTH domain
VTIKNREYMSFIGIRLKAYRENFGLSQDQIAEMLAIDRSTVSKYESGDREISVIHLNKLADLYGIEMEDFFTEEDSFQNASMSFAFRRDGLDSGDLNSIASFQKVVKNYLKMERILKNNEEIIK